MNYSVNENETDLNSPFNDYINDKMAYKVALIVDKKDNYGFTEGRMCQNSHELFEKHRYVDFYLKCYGEIDEYYADILRNVRSNKKAIDRCRIIVVSHEKIKKLTDSVYDGLFDKNQIIETDSQSDLKPEDQVNMWLADNCDVVWASVKYLRSKTYIAKRRAEKNKIPVIEM